MNMTGTVSNFRTAPRPACESIAAIKSKLHQCVSGNRTMETYDAMPERHRKVIFILGNHIAESAPGMAKLSANRLDVSFSALSLEERRTIFIGMEEAKKMAVLIPADRHSRDVYKNIHPGEDDHLHK